MEKRNSFGFLLFFLFSLIAPFHKLMPQRPVPPQKNGLLLISYHQGDRWNDSVILGVGEALESHEPVRLSIEDFDICRFTSQDHIRLATDYSRGKYQGRAGSDPGLGRSISELYAYRQGKHVPQYCDCSR